MKAWSTGCATEKPSDMTERERERSLECGDSALEVAPERGVAQGLDAALAEALGDGEGQLEGLGGVEAGVAVGVVARVEVVEGDRHGTANALRHILPCHLQVHSTRMAPLLLVHVEEGPQLRLPTTSKAS